MERSAKKPPSPLEARTKPVVRPCLSPVVINVEKV
jgi:hypothetical protein